MSERDDGGPAFPRPYSEDGAAQGGMSLRDWFAGQALTRLSAMHFKAAEARADPHDATADIAFMCYLQADAMLAEREKETKT